MLVLTLMVAFRHWKVAAEPTSLVPWAIACPISPGDGGASSDLPYFTNVAHRGKR